MRRFFFIYALLLAPLAAAPIPVKVVVMTTFEVGKDTGDDPGEYQFWSEREGLTERFATPALPHDIYMNADGVMGIVTGMTTANAATSITALASDPRFDFSKTYWLLAGIAGVDPADAPLGSAVWADYVVDGSIAFEIDAREMPKNWPDGYIVWDGTTPFEKPKKSTGELYTLNPSLVKWAYRLTRDVKIPDTAGLQKFRALFAGYPNFQKPPQVLVGSNLAMNTYWQGKIGTERANRWVKLWTKGRGNYVTSSCEDSGFLYALQQMDRAGKVDKSRALILRTASDSSVQAPGKTAAQSFLYGTDNAYFAAEAFDSAQRVGSVVVHELVKHWDQYRDTPPK
jgi:purine nucleoside permease